MIRPPEALRLGPGVHVDARVCALLTRYLKLDEVAARVRNKDSQLDATLVAIIMEAHHYGESSSRGTDSAPQPEPVRRLQRRLESDTVNTTTAATLLGITDRAVRKAITEKRLKADRLDGRYRIPRDALTAYKAER